MEKYVWDDNDSDGLEKFDHVCFYFIGISFERRVGDVESAFYQINDTTYTHIHACILPKSSN